MLASYDLNRLNVNPIEEAVKAAKELDEIKEMALNAFKTLRGYGDSADSGTSYIATAVKCVSEKAQIHLKLAKFKHPELSAVAFKDLSDGIQDKKPLSTAEAIDILRADPFAPQSIKDVKTEDVLKAMEVPLEAPALPMGKKE
jgi:hypothetical protein